MFKELRLRGRQKPMRTCPYCGSTEIKVERVMGQAPCNIWDDLICLNCKSRWEKHSKIDKLARAGKTKENK